LYRLETLPQLETKTKIQNYKEKKHKIQNKPEIKKNKESHQIAKTGEPQRDF
jgi:hypothetical protein